MYCHKCGAQSAPGQQFCPQCGTKLILSGEPAQSQTSPETKTPSVVVSAPSAESSYSSNPPTQSNSNWQIQAAQSVSRPAPTKSGTSTTVVVTVAVIVAAIIVYIGVGLWTTRYRSFQSAIDACETQFDSEHWEYNVGDDYNMFVIGDNGRSLTITTNSDNIDIAVCVLHELDMPNSVQSKMGHTRPLDGTQTDKWDGITATWTYSDDELTVILEH